MFRAVVPSVLFALILVGCGGSSSSSNSANQGGTSPTTPTSTTPAPTSSGSSTGISAINHVVILIQKNRSFDHYFGQMTSYRQSNGIQTADLNGMKDLAS